MTRLESIRAQIDRCDDAVIEALRERVYWVRKAHEGESGVRYEYERENEIYARYRRGLTDGRGTKEQRAIARAVINLGKAAVRDQT